MAGSTFGTLFRATTWGESHGAGIGAVVDGCPAGIPLKASDIQKYLDRRKPGQSRFTTARAESDEAEILSGVFNDTTEGTPISLLIRNNDQHSKDYNNLKNVYRPGHADFTFDKKYGFRDYRGGGRSSGRETAGRVAAGAVAAAFLKELGISVEAYAKSIGPFSVSDDRIDYKEALKNPLSLPDHEVYEKASEWVDSIRSEQDSAGGVIECRINGLPVGLGETVFDKLDALLSQAIMSIGAVKGFEIGDGFKAAEARGSENNDGFSSENNKIQPVTNRAGGVLGGMSSGAPVIFRAAVKPTPSISKEQQTVDITGVPKSLTITGRHDPLIVPRAVVVVESMACLTVADLLLRNMTARIDMIREFYDNLG